MLSRASRLIVLASFLMSIGMHRAALQAVAWAKMTVDFARRDTIAVSLEKTFDGCHPCPICISLKSAAPSSSLAAAPSHTRLGFVAPTAAPRVVRAVRVWDVAQSPLPELSDLVLPVAPPPKAALS